MYEFFRRYNLINPELIRTRISRFSNQALTNFTQRYIEIARNRIVDVESHLGMTDIYPDSSSTVLPIVLIKQFSIYTRKIYIHDPLLTLAEMWHDHGFNAYKHLNLDMGIVKFKSQLCETIIYLLDLKPLVESKIITLIDLSIPMSNREAAIYLQDFYTKDGQAGIQSSDILPESINILADQYLKIYQATVKDGLLEPLQNIPIYFDKKPLITSDKISFQFSGDPIHQSFHLSTKMRTSDKGNLQMFLSYRDGVSVDEDIFRQWVKAKKNQILVSRVNNLMRDIGHATKLGAKFLTNLPFSHEIALSSAKEDATTSGQVIRGLLNLKLPYFENATLESIAKARENESSFVEFVKAMDEAFRQINVLQNDANYQYHLEEIARDILIAPVMKIEQDLKNLNRTIFRDSGLLTIGTLFATILLINNTLFYEAAALAAANIVPQIGLLGKYREKENEIRQIPSFFYWDVTKKNS